MTTHAPTIAFSGIDCLDIDVQVQVAAGLPAFTLVGPIAAKLSQAALRLPIAQNFVLSQRGQNETR